MTHSLLSNQPKKVRNSNIELFRIVSMLLIIIHHYVVNSGLTNILYENPTSAKSLGLLVLGAFGKTGINCFVLITGYFMCKSQISTKKFFKLLLEVLFYRVLIYCVFWITGYTPFNFSSVITAIIPFRTVAQNFTGTFLLFFLFIPFLNTLIKNLTEKQHLMLLLLTSFVYVFFGTVPSFSVHMNYVSWYMVLFFIASYIRLYPKNIFDKTAFWGILSLFFAGVSALSVYVCGRVFHDNRIYGFVVDSNTFLAVATGLSSFLFFKNLKIKPNKFINTIASTCFGVLLIHAHSADMRNFLWVDLLDNIGAFNTSYTYLHAILSTIIIFAVCCAIDLLRINFIEKPFFVFWDKHWNKILNIYKKAERFIAKKFKIL